MTKPKEIVRAEQLLALAAYNPEGEEARTAAMMLVKHIVRLGLVIAMDGQQKADPGPVHVHYQPPPPPPTPPPPPPPPARDVSNSTRPRAPRRRGPKDPAGRPGTVRTSPAEKPIRLCAKFRGVCMHCKGTIYENDFIFWMPGAGATHEGCASAYKWPAKPKQEQAAP